MRRMVLGLALALAACATPSDPAADYARFKAAIHTGIDETGARTASSAPANEAKEANLYSGGEALALWAMVRKPQDGPARVVIAGSRARAILHADVKPTDPQGRYDRPEPASIGLPWRDADFVFLDRRTECYGEAFWCNRLQDFEIVLSPETVRAFIADGAPDSIPVALFTRRDVDWRVPKAELVATLEAVGAAEEFR